MKEFHANRLGGEDMGEMITIDAVLAHETFKNMETFWSEDVNTSVLEEVGARICGVFDEASVHEVLAHRLGHITGH